MEKIKLWLRIYLNYLILTVEKLPSWDLYDGFNVFFSRWQMHSSIKCDAKTEIKSAVHKSWVSYHYRIQISFYSEASGSNRELLRREREKLRKNLQSFLRVSLKKPQKRFENEGTRHSLQLWRCKLDSMCKYTCFSTPNFLKSML
jgi:hypothetical protein